MQAPPKFIRDYDWQFNLAMDLIRRERWTGAKVYIRSLKNRKLRNALKKKLEQTRRATEENKRPQSSTSSANQAGVHKQSSKILEFTREYIKSQLW